MQKIFLLLLLLFSTLFSSDSKNETLNRVSDALAIVIPLSALGTTIYLNDKDGQYDFYKAFGSTFVSVQALKLVVNEERPNEENEKSFPSGHASYSFSGASFIHFRYGFKYAAIPYLGAIFTAYARVQTDEHYVHDVVAGAILATTFSYYFTDEYKVKGATIQASVFNSIDNKHKLYGINVTW